MQAKTAKKKAPRKPGAKLFKLLEAGLLELRRLESKEAWEALSAEIEALQEAVSQKEAERAEAGKLYLESPKFQQAAKARLKRAREAQKRQKKEARRKSYAEQSKRQANLFALKQEGLFKPLKP